MSKKTLLFHQDDHTCISNFLRPLWTEYFSVEVFDGSKNYNKNSCILVTNYLNTNNWYTQYVDQGYRLIIDHLWDNDITATSYKNENKLTLQAKNWAWINEALWYLNLEYNKLTFDNNPNKFFLMPMRLHKPHRNMILSLAEPYLNDSLYSYVDKNIFLTDDIDPMSDMFQRHINTSWYNSTCFSLVAETDISQSTFLSEKTFKPIAFKHPFIVWGGPFTLKYLHDNKFETFDHYIDESYDTVSNNTQRLTKIITVVNDLYTQYKNNQRIFDDALTKEKLLYNYHRFYNYDLVKTMFTQEIIIPVLEFV